MKTGYATESRVRDMERELIANGRITEKEFKKQHKKHKKAKKELQIQEILRQEKESKEQIRNLIDEKILKLLKKGITPQEIANFLGIDIKTVYKRQEGFIRVGKLTIEQLKEYRKKRKQYFAEIRRKAINECEEDSDKCTSRKKFFELAQDEINYGNTLEKEDVKLLGRCIIYNDIFLTKENLKLVITQYIVKCEDQEIYEFFKTLMMLYGDTNYGDAIRDFRQYATDMIKERRSKAIGIGGER